VVLQLLECSDTLPELNLARRGAQQQGAVGCSEQEKLDIWYDSFA